MNVANLAHKPFLLQVEKHISGFISSTVGGVKFECCHGKLCKRILWSDIT